MKNFKTIIFPVALVFMAAGSAFATNMFKKSTTTVQGHVFRPNEVIQCQPTSKWCDNAGVYTCTIDLGMGAEDVYVLQGTSCPNKLTNSFPN